MARSSAPRRRSWLPWIALAAIAYVLMPLDVLPDLIPGVGWGDDLVLTLGAFVLGTWRRKRELEAEKAAAPREPEAPPPPREVSLQRIG